MRELLVMETASLGVLTSLFGRFHTEDIVYCNWKSNEHLGASMVGATDLDLLVDRKSALPLARILSQAGVKRFVVEPFHRYPGVEDYVCFDPHSGKLIHLHVHYQLTLGEKHLKGYRPPWEELVLSTRVLDGTHRIYVADPHVELLLLVVRAAVKLRVRDRLLAALRSTYMADKVVQEFHWLVGRIQRERLLELARPLVGDTAARLLVEMVGGSPPSKRQLLAFRQSAVPALRGYRTYGAWEARRRRWLREGRTLWWLAENRYYHVPKNSSRTCPQGGLAIAFVSPGGAGRSTLPSEIAAWLGEELAVLPITAPRTARGWRRRAARARSARDQGKIVILDGLPPADLCPLDLVVQLRPPRGSGATLSHPQYPTATRVVDVDAGQPAARVLPELKQTIWDSI